MARYQMTKEEAKGWMEWLIATGSPVHPETARRLYTMAEMPIPEYLLPYPMKYRRLESQVIDRLEEGFLDSLWIRKNTRQCGKTSMVMDEVIKRIERTLFGIGSTKK